MKEVFLPIEGTVPASGTLLYIGLDKFGQTCGKLRRAAIVRYVAIGFVWRMRDDSFFVDDDVALAALKPPATRNTPPASIRSCVR